jgi:hypothetical protein
MTNEEDLPQARRPSPAHGEGPRDLALAAMRLEIDRGRGARRDAGGGLVGRQDLDVAGELAARLDLDLGVAHRADDLAGRADEQALAHRQRALETAADLGLLDRGGALEETALGDVDVAAVRQIGLDAALDDETVARGDLARERDLATDDELAMLGLVGRTGALPELIPIPGREAGFPERPNSSFVSMIGFSSSSSVFLRRNISRHLLI